jgi:hypothetical protein
MIIISACNNHSEIKQKILNNESSLEFEKDTLINGNQIKITLKTEYLLNRVENNLNIEVDGVAKRELMIYTKSSEAKVKLSKNEGEFTITPTTEKNKVTIYLNTQKVGEIIELGKVELIVK